VGVAAINDAGEIVGWGVFPNAPVEAFLWRKGVATDLGNLGECASIAHTINAHRQVVGLAFSCDGTVARAFLWENGSIVDLNTLLPSGSSLQLADASTINDRGEITGTGTPPGIPAGLNFTSQGHGYLLIPCDDNHPNIEGCDYGPVETSAVAASHAPEEATPQKQLTAQELSRIRSLLMNRHGGFMPRTMH
jgi:probable HAF family extracellular repeat protein